MRISIKSVQGAGSGAMIGMLGGLVGLGGAEFRLPVLVGLFRLPTLEAVVLNKAMSLVVVTAALVFRSKAIPIAEVQAHLDVILNLLAGSLIGAWWAAGHAMRMSRKWLDRIILILLVALSVVMLTEALVGIGVAGTPLFSNRVLQAGAGVAAGLVIGMVAALLGVAGGELLIPTIVLLFGLDIKIAGSLSLAISLPTMIVGFIRYTQSSAMQILRQERTLFGWMAVGSVLGTMAGGMLLGVVSPHALLLLLGLILAVSAYKTFQHHS